MRLDQEGVKSCALHGCVWEVEQGDPIPDNTAAIYQGNVTHALQRRCRHGLLWYPTHTHTAEGIHPSRAERNYSALPTKLCQWDTHTSPYEHTACLGWQSSIGATTWCALPYSITQIIIRVELRAAVRLDDGLAYRIPSIYFVGILEYHTGYKYI